MAKHSLVLGCTEWLDYLGMGAQVCSMPCPSPTNVWQPCRRLADGAAIVTDVGRRYRRRNQTGPLRLGHLAQDGAPTAASSL